MVIVNIHIYHYKHKYTNKLLYSIIYLIYIFRRYFVKKIVIFVASLLLFMVGINVNSSSASAVKISESKTYSVDAFDKETSPFGEKLIAVKKNGKWGFMNINGKMVIQPQFQQAHNFFEGLAAVEIQGKWGYINKTGKVVIKAEYDHAAYQFVNGYAQVSKDGKWGNIDKEGNIIIPITYEDSNAYNDGLILVKQNGKFGYINIKNEMVIEPQFTNANTFNEGAAAVEKNNKWGYINTTGELIISYQYLNVYSFSNGVAVVQNNDEVYGAINKSGKTVVPFKYSYLTYPQNNLMGYAYENSSSYDIGYLSVKTGKKAFKIIQTDYEPLQFREGLAFVFAAPQDKAYSNIIYTSSGNKINLKNKYYYVMFFNNGYALGSINEKGTKIKILQKK